VLRNFGRGVNGVGDHFNVSNVVATGNAVGLWVAGNSASVSSSNVSRNSAFGLSLDGDHAAAKSVIAFGNANVGIQAGGNGLKLTSVTAAENGDVGVHAGGNSVSITKSTAIGNGQDGIDISGGSTRYGDSSPSNNPCALMRCVSEWDRSTRDRARCSGSTSQCSRTRKTCPAMGNPEFPGT
jgi:hypothetical protein